MGSPIPEPLIHCLSSGMAATDREVDMLARRIWAEAVPARSAFAWGALADGAPERRFALRSAAIALNGCAEPPRERRSR